MLIKKIEEVALNNRDKCAYKINNESITYGELFSLASKYASFLVREGTKPVILYGHKSINMFISIFACILAKRAYVPIDVSVPLYRIKKIIKLCNASLFIANEKFEENLDINICSLDSLEKYKDDLVKDNNNRTAYIIFTSGSTGEPKGVPISYGNLENFIDWISNLECLSEYKNINVLNQASFNFDLSVADIFYSVCNGHTLVGLDKNIQDSFNGIFKVIKNNSINLIVTTPTFMKLCLVNSDFNEGKFRSLKCIYFCGEQLETSLMQKLYDKFTNIKVINAYGPTEATSAVSAILITKDMLNDDILPVGKIKYSATEIEIQDDEIVLKGKSVFSGYLSNIHGGYYIQDGKNCYKTGDIGYIENDLLFCKGRIDNQIKFKGYRIELGEIENCLNKIEGIKESAVVCKRDNNIVKAIKAFVVCDNLDEVLIKNNLKKILPSYMIPKNITILEQLPINNNGKLDRKKLESYD